MWNGIGGKIEEGETEINAAKRECFEETKIKLENPKLETNIAVMHNVKFAMFLFFCTFCIMLFPSDIAVVSIDASNTAPYIIFKNG